MYAGTAMRSVFLQCDRTERMISMGVGGVMVVVAVIMVMIMAV